MEHMEAEGETIDDAIENALNTLRVEREQVTVEILSDVKKRNSRYRCAQGAGPGLAAQVHRHRPGTTGREAAPH